MLDFKAFVESISGMEQTTPFGPVYGRPDNRRNVSTLYTDTLIGSDDNIYTEGDYNRLYIEYLKKGNPPLVGGFNYDNLDIVLGAVG